MVHCAASALLLSSWRRFSLNELARGPIYCRPKAGVYNSRRFVVEARVEAGMSGTKKVLAVW